MIDWFVNFEHFSYELHNDTPYGLIPDSLDLVPLGDLILETFGGEWGSEEKSEKASVHIRCIRGTDIPNVLEANYRDIPPFRYVKASAASAKCVQSGDIIIKISGGSPIQSTGRLCLITEELLDDLEVPGSMCKLLPDSSAEKHGALRLLIRLPAFTVPAWIFFQP